MPRRAGCGARAGNASLPAAGARLLLFCFYAACDQCGRTEPCGIDSGRVDCGAGNEGRPGRGGIESRDCAARQLERNHFEGWRPAGDRPFCGRRGRVIQSRRPLRGRSGLSATPDYRYRTPIPTRQNSTVVATMSHPHAGLETSPAISGLRIGCGSRHGLLLGSGGLLLAVVAHQADIDPAIFRAAAGGVVFLNRRVLA
jgi:hypothetical protein